VAATGQDNDEGVLTKGLLWSYARLLWLWLWDSTIRPGLDMDMDFVCAWRRLAIATCTRCTAPADVICSRRDTHKALHHGIGTWLAQASAVCAAVCAAVTCALHSLVLARSHLPTAVLLPVSPVPSAVAVRCVDPGPGLELWPPGASYVPTLHSFSPRHCASSSRHEGRPRWCRLSTAAMCNVCSPP
jgi:hypothetical protein